MMSSVIFVLLFKCSNACLTTPDMDLPPVQPTTEPAAQCPTGWDFVDGKCYRVIVEYHFANNNDFPVFWYCCHLEHSKFELHGIMRPRNLPSTKAVQPTAKPELA
ncbi:hypothetical protein WR25_01926 [Diploscapter pachys]|uniref:Uncharacterized protein n=1 Tax=Diploscapter pachys TaxID=2018661 RepID=A0A2A2JR75_9BILA|nr:hypothetical protein WR25_01926 [Diploscapter pachys]